MNNVAKKLALTLLLSAPVVQATTGLSFFFPRAQLGTLKDVIGWNNQINVFGAEEFSLVFKTQTEAGQSFNSTKLAQYITSNDTASMVFGPSQGAAVAANATTDVSGLNFLLAQDFESTVTFAPKITNSVTDFGFYADFSNWVEGLHARLHVPLQYSKYNTGITEVIAVEGAANYTADYVKTTAGAVAYTNVISAFVGQNAVSAGTDMLQNWNYGLINGAQHHTKISDITLSLGYNFVNTENGHFGLEIGGLFGCGGKSKAVYMFEPVFGHAGRMGVFGTVDAHAELWSASEGDKRVAAYFNAQVGGIFANHQTRSYDLTTSGVWSRYNLVKKLGTIGTTTNTVYDGIDNMINIGTLEAKIGDFVFYEGTLMVDFQYNNFDFDLAWQFGGHSAEKHKGFIDTITADTYIVYDPIRAGDNILLAPGASGNAAGASGVDFLPVSGLSTGTTISEVVTGATTICLSNSSLNIDSALAPSVFANAVVAGANYTWRDNDWLPSVGLFGKAEFSSHANNTANIWMVGLQGNVTF